MDFTPPNLAEDASKSLNPINSGLTPEIVDENVAVLDETAAHAAAWQTAQDKFADETGLAILLIDGHQPPALHVSNNNSVCRVVQSSEKHRDLCEPFCGTAFDRMQQAGGQISYLCHAGLQCVVAPLEPNVIRPLAAIVGRAFVKVSDYQNLLDRVNSGDWQQLPTAEVDRNLLFAENAEEVGDVADILRDLSRRESESLIEFVARTEPNPLLAENSKTLQNALADEPVQIVQTVGEESTGNQIEQTAVEPPAIARFKPEQNGGRHAESNFRSAATTDETNEAIEDFTAWQLFTDSLLDKSFKAACSETLRFLAARYKLMSLAWLERTSNNQLKPFLISDALRENFPQTSFAANIMRLQTAILDETSYRPADLPEVEIFPLAVGEDVRAALLVADEISDEERRRRIAKFCHQIAVSLEVLRLREELARRAEIVSAVQLFNEKLNETTPDNLFERLMETCAEFLSATRSSLLIFDEIEQKLKVVAAVGQQADEMKKNLTAVGERVAEQVFLEGKPVVIENAEGLKLPPAPLERGYVSESFISFPLITGNRTVGVLNVTDKRNDGNYTQNDLDLLEAIAPQLAIALDRATYQQRAGMFEQLSITDSLTGLLNRRYLNERLSEEVNRSNRDGSPMSFLMIDIDNFKSYNDQHGHQAGDEVLRMTAQCLRAVLRSADVAARYGGEEFCLLLPQTTLSEARLIAERIRERIEQTTFPERLITVSVGVAAYSPFHNTPKEIIEAADKALYQAKRIGKNNVQIWLFGQTRR